MAAAAHNSAIAKDAGIPQKVAQEYNQADKAKRLAALLHAQSAVTNG